LFYRLGSCWQLVMAMALPSDYFSLPPRLYNPPAPNSFSFVKNEKTKKENADLKTVFPSASEAYLRSLEILRNHPTAERVFDATNLPISSLPPQVENIGMMDVENFRPAPTKRIRKNRKKLSSKAHSLFDSGPKKIKKARSSKQQRFKFLCAHCKEYFLAKPTWRATKGHFVLNHQCEGGTRKQFVVGKKRQTCTDYHYPRSCITFAHEHDEPVMEK